MPIDDPQAVSFVNVYARPIAESLIALKAKLAEAKGEWDANNLQPMFGGANSGETVQDNNAATNPVTGQDVIDWAVMVNDILTVQDAVGAMDPVHRLAVRALELLT